MAGRVHGVDETTSSRQKATLQVRSSARPPTRAIGGMGNQARIRQLKQEAREGASQPPNRTGIPDALKAGVEALSGISLDGVNVHYNSPKPARLHALAFTQGSEIHVGPGQEQHLPHEAWHVVQQAQGRVRPTTLAQGVALNEDVALEQEADVQGRRAAQMKTHAVQEGHLTSTRVRKESAGAARHGMVAAQFVGRPIQRVRVEQDPDEERIEEAVKSMNERAVGAAVNMLFDFQEKDDDMDYFLATNEEPGGNERFGLMSLKGAPGVQPGQPGPAVAHRIDGSVWVEGLVADPGSGLGSHLLQSAEAHAAKQGRAISLAAYEYDPADQGMEGSPYSIAGYYGDKRGYQYSGEAYVESDPDHGDYFYPIYIKDSENQAYQRLQEVKDLTDGGNHAAAANLYMSIYKEILPKENWSDRMKLLDASMNN